MIAQRVIIYGRVQGVGYRAWSERQAREARIVGWVRNLPDGAVEALFQGEAEAVTDVVARCYTGPRFSKVSRIDIFDVAPDLQFTDFCIHRQ